MPNIEAITAIVDSIPTAVVMVDKAGAIKLFNTQAEAVFKYTRSELIGKSVDTLVPERFKTHRELRAGFDAQPTARPMGAGRDLFARRKDGVDIPVEIGLNPIKIGDETCTLATVIDLTERKRATEELQRANDALARSNQDLQRFAYIASHDLQSPLRNIAGFLQLLHLEYGSRLDAQAGDWIARAIKSIEQLQLSIRDLLAYSRVDSTAKRSQMLSFQSVLNDALQALETSLHACHAQVTAGELPEVCGDFAQLSQLLKNLIANAVKYRGEKSPAIHLSAERGVNEWIFSVSDNGIGIETKYLERIFEIFYRLHDTQKYEGTGIGLAICRRVVERHGGRIWAESKLGEGSVFRFTLPDKPSVWHD